MKHPTMSRWKVTRTIRWYVSTALYWNIVTMSQKRRTTTSHQYASTTSQTCLRWNTQQHLDISCKSKMKQPMTLLWYVCTTSPSNVVAMPCCYLLLLGFHVSFKYQIKHQIFLVYIKRERKKVVWIRKLQTIYYS